MTYRSAAVADRGRVCVERTYSALMLKRRVFTIEIDVEAALAQLQRARPSARVDDLAEPARRARESILPNQPLTPTRLSLKPGISHSTQTRDLLVAGVVAGVDGAVRRVRRGRWPTETM